jgi:hypothetical protein
MAQDPDEEEIEEAVKNKDVEWLKSVIDWYRDPEAGGKSAYAKGLGVGANARKNLEKEINNITHGYYGEQALRWSNEDMLMEGLKCFHRAWLAGSQALPTLAATFQASEVHFEENNANSDEKFDGCTQAEKLLATLQFEDGEDTEIDLNMRSALVRHELAAAIDAFEAVCRQEEYTDSGDAWDLLNRIRSVLKGDTHD